MKDVRVALVVVAFSLLAGACSDKKDSSGGSAENSETSGETDTAETTSPTEDTTVAKSAASAKRKEQCETSCLLLNEHSIEDLVGDGYCKLCGSAVADACTAPNPFAKDNCDQFDYQRNCVFAAAGYKFRKKKWQTMFGKNAWYEARDDFKHSDLSSVAQANVKALRDRTSVCRGKSDGPVSVKDMELVRRFFRSKKAKKLSLPKILYVDNQPATSEQFLSFLMTEDLFELKSFTPVRYQDWGPSGEIDKSKYRSIHVPTGHPGPRCEKQGGEGCEGFEWLDIVLDSNGKVVELGVSAAACPYVYLETVPGTFTFVGEILRNRNRRSLEQTQDLALPIWQTTNVLGKIRIRIAEEKAERSFLDSVSLMVGDQEISPRQCDEKTERRGARVPAYCLDDGRYHIIEPGEAVVLEFESSTINNEINAPSIRANGYYQPLPTQSQH